MAVELIPARLSTQGEVLRISVGTGVTGISFQPLSLSAPPADHTTFFFFLKVAITRPFRCRAHRDSPKTKARK